MLKKVLKDFHISFLWLVLRSIRNEPKRIWTSTELYEIYISKGAQAPLVFAFSIHWKKTWEKYCISKASRLAAIYIHKEKTASIFKVISLIDYPDEEIIIKVAKMIKADIAKKKQNISTYSSLKKDTPNEYSSRTLSFMLSQIFAKLKDSLVALLNTFSMLQLALALLVNGKRVIETLHEFGITPTYHELRRLKASAVAADKNESPLNMNASDGLIQVITDNFAAINSENGMKQTHALASIFAQAKYSDEDNNEFKFSRPKQGEIKSGAVRNLPLSIYSSPKKPKMNPYFATSGISQLKLLCTQILLAKRSRAEDYKFI